jgi:RNA polymerase sigma-70 factor (ECF subfamily)
MMRNTAESPWMIMTPSRRPLSPVKSPASDVDFETLFNLHWEPLCRTLFRLLGDWDEAEDLALEAFLQYHRRPPLDDTNRIGWLYRVATNLGFNALRARKRRRQYEDQAGLHMLEQNSSVDPAQDLERRLEQQRVRRTLQSIKPRSARILLLRYSGLSYAEIAAALELSAGSVGTLLARAEKEFEESFEK